ARLAPRRRRFHDRPQSERRDAQRGRRRNRHLGGDQQSDRRERRFGHPRVGRRGYRAGVAQRRLPQHRRVQHERGRNVVQSGHQLRARQYDQRHGYGGLAAVSITPTAARWRSGGVSALFALALTAVATDVSALPRTFVASFGLDSNGCSLSSPCRGFTKALAVTDPGGEIVVLDSAGYGAVTIDKSVSIIVPTGI